MMVLIANGLYWRRTVLKIPGIDSGNYEVLLLGVYEELYDWSCRWQFLKFICIFIT